VTGPEGHDTLLHGWSSAALTPLRLTAGRRPAGPDEVVLEAALARRGGLRVGATVGLAATEARPLQLVGIAAAPSPLRLQGAAFVTDAEAARLAGHPERVDAIGVLTEPGADVERVVDAARRVAGRGADVRTGARRGAAEFLEFDDAREGILAITATFGVLALVVAMFVVAGTLGLAIQLRERELALLRAIAATPRQVRRLLRWEAALLALVAAAAGYLPGVALADALNGAFAARGLAPEGMEIAGGPLPAVVTAASVLLAALASAWIGSRRAARVAPTRALQAAALEPRIIGMPRLVGGMLALAAGIGAVAVAAAATDLDDAAAASLFGSLVLVIAVALLGPLVARFAALVPGALVARIAPVGGFLAVAATRTAPRRVASALTPIALTVAMGSTMLFTATTMDHEAARQSRDRQAAQLAVHADGLGVPDTVLAQVSRTPGVVAAVGIAPTGAVAVDELGSAFASIPAQMIDGEHAADVLDLDVEAGALDGLHGHTVALGSELARPRHIHIGDQIPLALGDGTVMRLRVVATYERSLGFGPILLPRELAAPHATDPLPQSVLVRTAPGVPVGQVAARLRALVKDYAGIEVAGRAVLTSADDANRSMRLWLSRVLVGLIFAFTAVAAINTLSMIALARGRELALLRLVGATPRQIARMARWEAGLVVVVGIGLGAAVSLAALMPFSKAVSGSPTPFAPPLQVAAIVVVTAAIGFLASHVPTRLALRAKAVDAIGLRE
jgi:putative ABC transport system permease protein